MNDKKPFPCDTKGCTKSFNTEHHLKCHLAKHEMILNLEMPDKSNVYSDQTPTPTRLIKNCEEVGLFEDLQHVNPFEETFRNACKIEPTLLTAHNPPILFDLYGEELHTPQIFPHYSIVDQEKKRTNDSKLAIVSHTPATHRELKPAEVLVADNKPDAEEEVIKNIPKKRKYQEVKLEKCTNDNQKVEPKILHMGGQTAPIETTAKRKNALPRYLSVEANTRTVVATTEAKKTPVGLLLKNTKSVSRLSLELPVKVVNEITETKSEIAPDTRSQCCDKIKELVQRKQLAGMQNSGSSKEVAAVQLSVVVDEGLAAIMPKTKLPAKTKEKDATKSKNTGSNREAARRYRQKMKQTHTELSNKTTHLEAENFQLKKELRFLKSLALKCECGVFRKPPSGLLNDIKSKEVVHKTADDTKPTIASKIIKEKHKTILPAPPPTTQISPYLLAGTLTNCNNLKPVYLVLASADDQNKSKSS